MSIYWIAVIPEPMSTDKESWFWFEVQIMRQNQAQNPNTPKKSTQTAHKDNTEHLNPQWPGTGGKEKQV